MKEIRVNASKSYSVLVGDSWEGFSWAVAPILKGEKILVVTDSVVDGIYPDFTLKFGEKKVYKYVVPSGEKSKNFDNYLKIVEYLADNEFTRNDAVIAFGGGVVGDLAGFVASTYMRGTGFINVATTVLSAVDSSVGGKTAVDLKEGKNLVGTFFQPDLVFINTDLFKTLPEKEIQNGFGEIIKYKFLSDDISPDEIKGEPTESLIEKCVRIKKEIVEKDEREGGIRKLLNLGHTFGHAIEKLSKFNSSHGSCVVKGLKMILDLSAKYYGMNDEKYEEAKNVLISRGHDLTVPYSKEDILRAIRNDKKGNGRGVDLVLLNGALKPEIVFFDYEKIRELLK